MHRTKRTQSLCVIGLAAAVVLSPAQAADDAKLIAAGKALFQLKICFTCHQVDENVPAPAGIAMKAPKFIGGFWGKKRTVTLGYGGPEATVTFDEARVSRTTGARGKTHTVAAGDGDIFITP